MWFFTPPEVAESILVKSGNLPNSEPTYNVALAKNVWNRVSLESTNVFLKRLSKISVILTGSVCTELWL